MRTMKWVSTMITAGMLLASAPAFAQDTTKKDDTAAAAAKPDDAAPAPKVTKTKKGKKKKPAPDAAAADTAAAPAADADDETTEVKAGTSISKREIVGEADSFTAGKKVWVWSSVKGQAGKSVKMIWKRDDKQLWEKDFDVSSGRFRTWTRHTCKAGSYTVEVQDADGKVLGSVSFTVA